MLFLLWGHSYLVTLKKTTLFTLWLQQETVLVSSTKSPFLVCELSGTELHLRKCTAFSSHSSGSPVSLNGCTLSSSGRFSTTSESKEHCKKIFFISCEYEVVWHNFCLVLLHNGSKTHPWLKIARFYSTAFLPNYGKFQLEQKSLTGLSSPTWISPHTEKEVVCTSNIGEKLILLGSAVCSC